VEAYPTPTYLRNYESVLSAFGYWPSFHDSPLQWMQLSSAPTAALEMVIHTGEMTPKPDEHGYHSWLKNHLVAFRFTGVRDLEFQQFNIPNTLIEMTFSPPSEFESSGRFTVHPISVMGGDCFARFSAAAGEVLSVKPSDKEGNPV
jgi:Immunity protein 50